jgi:hypothetical protein
MANGESVVEHATHGPDVNGAKLTLEDPAIKVGSRWDQGKKHHSACKAVRFVALHEIFGFRVSAAYH